MTGELSNRSASWPVGQPRATEKKRTGKSALDEGIDKLGPEHGEAVRVCVREAELAKLLVHLALVALGELSVRELWRAALQQLIFMCTPLHSITQVANTRTRFQYMC